MIVSACAAGLVRIALAFRSGPGGDATCKSGSLQLGAKSLILISDVGDLVEFVIWSSVEECIGIICACVPTLASLLQRLAKNRSQNKSSQNGNVRPRYMNVEDNAFDQESLYGLHSSEAEYELSAPITAKTVSATLANTGENKWHRKVEVATPERARQQIPGKEIKVDTKLEWRSDRVSTEMPV